MVCRYGSAYHIRCEECCDNRYSHHDRVEEVAYDTEGESERGDDECELTYLCHGESASQGLFQRLSGEQISERAEGALANENGKRDDDDRQGVVDENLRLHKHTHRDEEYGSEEVFHRLYHLYYLISLDSLGKDAAHDECSESA